MNYRCEILHRLIVDRSLWGGLHKAHKVTVATIVRKGDAFNAYLHAKLVPQRSIEGLIGYKMNSFPETFNENSALFLRLRQAHYRSARFERASPRTRRDGVHAVLHHRGAPRHKNNPEAWRASSGLSVSRLTNAIREVHLGDRWSRVPIRLRP